MTRENAFEIRDLLQREYDRDCDLARLGSRVAYSPTSVLRGFRDLWGMTPRQYVEATRYREAKRLLVESDFTVSEICFEVGYQSVPSFVRRFKEFHGCTPTEFRIRQRHFWAGWRAPAACWIPMCMANGPTAIRNLG